MGRPVLTLSLWRCEDSVTTLILEKLGEHIKHNHVLKKISMRGFRGNKGAKQMAEAMAVSASLTEVLVLYERFT